MARGECVVAEAEPLDGARRKVVDEHVGAREQLFARPRGRLRSFTSSTMLRLPRFSQAKYAETSIQRAVVCAREIAAARTFDLDDVGAHVRELPRAKGRDDRLFERDDANRRRAEASLRRQNDLGIPSTCSPMYERIMFVEIGAT